MDISMLLQNASESIIDWTDDDDDYHDSKACGCDNKDKSNSPVPLILVTDHLDEFTDAKSQESEEPLKVIFNALY